MSAGRPRLRTLSSRLGVVDVFYDLTGARRETSDATREALCAAMGRDASSEAAAERALAALGAEESGRVLEPVQVWRQHAGLAPALPLRHPGSRGGLAVRVELCQQDGSVAALERELPGMPAGRPLRLPLPGSPPAGRHRVRLEWSGGHAEQCLWVVPHTAFGVAEALGGDRGLGIWTSLYTLRRRRSGHFGFGDLSDLADLLRLCGSWGVDFVGINPLHAIPARGDEVSPYAPVSRLYASPLYLDVEAVPELADCEAARARLVAPAFQAGLASLRAADAIDYGAVLDAKLELLRELHRCSQARRERREACAAYREREGRALLDFATFEAIAAEQGGADWRRWPASLHDARGAAVARFRADHAREVDFRCWLQFELDRQLGEVARTGRAAGLRIGLLADLAVGSAPGSADTWSFDPLFASGASVGAPPDAFAAGGQDWGVAPLDPHALRADGYRWFGRLLASGFRHAGALRIDHVMGLQRLFWIPQGRPPSEGAYVRYPRDELLGVLACESRRHRALAVGEDLGTVPADLPAALASFCILSSAVLVFERDGGGFRPASEISARALACTNTHDLAPLAGFLAGRDLELRRRAGEPEDAESYARARKERAADCAAWLARLHAEGVAKASGSLSPADWVAATSAFLARTPAPLVAVALDDLAGETDPVHLPGIGSDRHPGWRRRMRRTLEELASGGRAPAGLPRVGRAVDMLPAHARRPG